MPTFPAARSPVPPSRAEICEPGDHGRCPVTAAVGVIGTEWRLVMIHRLLDGPQRFSELLRTDRRLNAKTLSATLKHLESAGVVQRNVVSTRPFVVVYSLTEMGLALGPAARELRLWGERFVLPQAPKGRERPAGRSRAIMPELPPVPRETASSRAG